MILATTTATILTIAALKFWFGVFIGIIGGVAYFWPHLLFGPR